MPNLDHPTLPFIKSRFTEDGKRSLFATEFRGETTLVVGKDDLHGLLSFLKNDDDCKYDFLSDIAGIDYLNYPATKTRTRRPGASRWSTTSSRPRTTRVCS